GRTRVDIIKAVLSESSSGSALFDLAIFFQQLQCANHNRVGVDTEVATCSSTSVRETEIIGTQGGEFVRNVLTDLIRQQGSEVSGCYNWTLGFLHHLGDVWNAWFLIWLQELIAFSCDSVGAQFVPASDRPDVCGDAPVVCQNFSCLNDPRQGHAGAEEICLWSSDVRSRVAVDTA